MKPCIFLTLAASTLFIGSAFAGAISVNGTCEFGVCTPADTLSEGNSLTNPFNFIYTFANTDQYQAIGTLAATNLSNSTGYIEITAAGITLTYLGNNSGTASGSDTLVVDFLQNFQTPFGSGTGNNGFEYISGSFGGPLANASSVQGQGISNSGTAQAVLGPFFAPTPFSASNTNQPTKVGPTTLLDFKDTILFAAGSGIGSTINVSNTPSPATPTPEPSAGLLMTGSLFLLFRFRRMLLKTTVSGERFN